FVLVFSLSYALYSLCFFSFFFFYASSSSVIYTLSLHDALPICNSVDISSDFGEVQYPLVYPNENSLLLVLVTESFLLPTERVTSIRPSSVSTSTTSTVLGYPT